MKPDTIQAYWYLNSPQLLVPHPMANHQNPNSRFVQFQAFCHTSERFCLKTICAFEYKDQIVMENCEVNFHVVTSFNLHLNEECNWEKQRSPN
jgi:hypothetical protein